VGQGKHLTSETKRSTRAVCPSSGLDTNLGKMRARARWLTQQPTEEVDWGLWATPQGNLRVAPYQQNKKKK